MDTSFYSYLEKYYSFLSGIYSSPLLPGSTLILLGFLYFLVAPNLVRKNAKAALGNSFYGFFLGIVVLSFFIGFIFLLTLGIITIPIALLLSLVLLLLSLLASLNLFIFVYGEVFKLLKLPLPTGFLLNYLCFLVTIILLGFVSLIPKIGGVVITVLFIISVGNSCYNRQVIKC